MTAAIQGIVVSLMLIMGNSERGQEHCDSRVQLSVEARGKPGDATSDIQVTITNLGPASIHLAEVGFGGEPVRFQSLVIERWNTPSKKWLAVFSSGADIPPVKAMELKGGDSVSAVLRWSSQETRTSRSEPAEKQTLYRAKLWYFSSLEDWANYKESLKRPLAERKLHSPKRCSVASEPFR